MRSVRIEFHPTEDGRVECLRWRANGYKLKSFFYTSAFRPLGLTDDQKAEFEAALELAREQSQ